MSHPQNLVPFPLLEGGAVLRFRTADFIELREKYGEPKIVEEPFKPAMWETFTDRIERLVKLGDPIAIVDCLKAGLKDKDGYKKLTAVAWDDLPFSLEEPGDMIIAAIIAGTTGKTYAQILQVQAAARAEAERNAALRARGVEFNGEAPADPPEALMEPTSSIGSSRSDIQPGS